MWLRPASACVLYEAVNNKSRLQSESVRTCCPMWIPCGCSVRRVPCSASARHVFAAAVDRRLRVPPTPQLSSGSAGPLSLVCVMFRGTVVAAVQCTVQHAAHSSSLGPRHQTTCGHNAVVACHSLPLAGSHVLQSQRQDPRAGACGWHAYNAYTRRRAWSDAPSKPARTLLMRMPCAVSDGPHRMPLTSEEPPRGRKSSLHMQSAVVFQRLADQGPR